MYGNTEPSPQDSKESIYLLLLLLEKRAERNIFIANIAVPGILIALNIAGIVLYLRGVDQQVAMAIILLASSVSMLIHHFLTEALKSWFWRRFMLSYYTIISEGFTEAKEYFEGIDRELNNYARKIGFDE